MRSQSVYKIPEGKLLRISVEYSKKKNVIKDIWITGDFFAYPEESIELMEKTLRNTVFAQEHVLEKIQAVINEYHIEFLGVDAEGLTKGILMCKL